MSIEPNENLLLKYVHGQCTPEEITFVESWIKSDVEIKEKYDRLKLMLTSKEYFEQQNARQQEMFRPGSARTLREQLIEYGWYFVAIVAGMMVFYLIKTLLK